MRAALLCCALALPAYAERPFGPDGEEMHLDMYMLPEYRQQKAADAAARIEQQRRREAIAALTAKRATLAPCRPPRDARAAFTLHLNFDPRGTVRGALFSDGGSGDARADACVLGAASRWRIAALRGRTVDLPIRFGGEASSDVLVIPREKR